jgi:hypothetical protein
MRFHMDAMLAASPPAPNKRDAATRVRYIFFGGTSWSEKQRSRRGPSRAPLLPKVPIPLRLHTPHVLQGRSPGAERFQTSIKAQQKEAPGALTASRAAKKRNQSAQQANDNPQPSDALAPTGTD